MTKKQKTEAIKTAIETLGLSPKAKDYTISQLEAISRSARVQMWEVMSYLRYGKLV